MRTVRLPLGPRPSWPGGCSPDGHGWRSPLLHSRCAGAPVWHPACSPRQQRGPDRGGGARGAVPVLEVSDEEVLFGEDDRHLDYRVSLLARDRQATLSTV